MIAVVASGTISLGSVIVPKVFGVVTWLPTCSWFVGMIVGLVICTFVARANDVAGSANRPLELGKLRV